MRILLTGGAGFIGSHLSGHLEAAGHDIILIDRKINQEHDLLVVGAAERWIGLHKPDVVVHLAAQVGRLFGEDDPRYTIESNALMTTLVAQACATEGSRMVYASTSEVYGDPGDRIMVESYPIDQVPHNLYGLSKRWGEEACRLYASQTGLQILRLSMPFGPGLPAGRGRAAIVNMLDQASRGADIPVHRGATRCWCWIGDTVEGIRRVIEQGEVMRDPDEVINAGRGIYNVGRDDNELSMLAVATHARMITGNPDSEIVMIDAPGNQTVVKRLATQKLRDLDWHPTVEVYEGMELTWHEMNDRSVSRETP